MNRDDARFEAAQVLAALRVSASEFGYRAQALFAESLAQMGATVEKIARIGHPDITARIGGRTLRIQTKATGQRSFALDPADFEGIRPRSTQEEGYLAVLDRGPPVAWTCVRYAKAHVLVGRIVPLAMLQSMADAEFSTECTGAFVDLIVEHRASVEAFTFSLVSRRTLARSEVL